MTLPSLERVRALTAAVQPLEARGRRWATLRVSWPANPGSTAVLPDALDVGLSAGREPHDDGDDDVSEDGTDAA